jgi:hypothetical protein
MPWECGNCGSDTSRGSQTFDLGGKQVREVCPTCDPEKFDGAFRDPSDKKIYSGPQAMPTLYKQDSEGMYHAKDELISDTVEGWNKGPTELAKDRKRASRRTEPPTPAEVEKNRIWGEQVLGPILREGGVNAVVAALNQEKPSERPEN